MNLSVNHTSPPSGVAGIRIQNQSINDSGKNSVAIADGTYPWRKSWVSATGSIATFKLPTERSVYMAASLAFTPGATPTDVATIFGSATKTVRVLRAWLSTTQNTAGTNTWLVIKRSTANSGGSSTNLDEVAVDSIQTAATATTLNYTSNPSLGATVGKLYSARVFSPAPATAGGDRMHIIDFTNSGISRGIVLRGTAQGLAINFNGAALPAGLSVCVTFEWIEE